jgi:hypothetical protein
MNYDPDDRKVTLRQVLAGWTLCLAVIGLAFAAMGRQHAIPSVDASGLRYATAAGCCSIGGARLPESASYAANKSRQRAGPVNNEAGGASGLFNMMRNLGGAIGTAASKLSLPSRAVPLGDGRAAGFDA